MDKCRIKSCHTPYYWVMFSVLLLLNSEMTCVVITCEYIIRELGGPYFQMIWILSSYLLGASIGALLAPFILPLLGPRYATHILLLGLSIVSFLTAWPDTYYTILLLRFLSGCIGTILLTQINYIAYEYYSEKIFNEYAFTSSLLVGIGNTVGLLIGAFVSELIDWRMVFMGYSGLYLILFFYSFLFHLPNIQLPSTKFPLGRALLFATTLLCIQAILDFGYQLLWFESPYLRALLYIALFCLLLFILSELIYKKKLFCYCLLREPNFCVYSLSMGLLMGVGLMAYMAFSVWLFNGLGYTGILTSTMLFFTAVPIVILSFVSKKLLKVYSFKSLAITGYLILVSLGIGIRYGFYNELPFSYIALMRLSIGICLGLGLPAITAGALSRISPEQKGDALGLFTFLRLWLSALFMSGFANMSIFMTIFQQYNIAYASSVFSYGLRDMLNTFASMHIPFQKGVAIITEELQGQASVLSLITVFELVTAIGLFLTLCTIFFTKGKKMKRDTSPAPNRTTSPPQTTS